VIEAGMYFALGLATAGLLALMIAPLFWRRAVRRTRAEIEHAVPRSLGEIQAEKDQLRAEFAMSTRRLEMSVERLREKAGEHLAEINDKRSLVKRLAEEQTRRVAAVEQLEAREAELSKLLQRREERLKDNSAELETVRTSLAERSRALEQLEHAMKRANETAEQKTIELVARGTEVDNLRDQLSSAKARQMALHIERTRLETAVAEAHASQTVDTRKIESLERRIARMESERTAAAAELDGRDREIERLGAEIAALAGTAEALEQRLVETEAAFAEASAEAARLTLDLDEAGHRDHHAETNEALASLEHEREALLAQIAALQDAFDRTAAENTELRRIAGDAWETERMQNALLRERLNDIAGEVVRLTRSYRGDMGLAELTVLAGGADADPDRPPTRPVGDGSLADRIRALQRSAKG
jgi:chromosome segregation ATPase